VVSGAEQQVEEEKLTRHVGDVQHLCGSVQRHQIVTVAVSDTKAEESFRQIATKLGTAAGAVALLVLEVMVEMSNHVFDRLFSSLRVQSVLDRLGSLDEIVDVDAGTVIQQSPKQTRQVKQQRLQTFFLHSVIVTSTLEKLITSRH